MSEGERIFSAVFGLLLLLVGIYVLFPGHGPVFWRIVAGAVLALLGGNMIYAAYRRKRSWLSKIGPLP